MSIDIFHHRNMIEAVMQMKPARRFLVDMFFNRVSTHDSDAIDIDIKKGGRIVAPYVSPLIEGKVIDNLGYSTNKITPPYAKPKKQTKASEYLKRPAGAHTYTPMTMLEKASMKLGEDLRELNDSLDRLEEKQAAEALNTGIVTAVGEGQNISVDYQMPSTHKITLVGVNLWSDSQSDPIQDLRTWQRLILQDSGVNPTDVIFGADAYDTFIKHSKVQGVLDLRRLDIGEIRPEMLADGVTYIGRIPEIGCDLWLYLEWYYDGSTEQPMVPAKKVWMASTRADCRRHYGAIVDEEAGTFELQRFPKSWVEKDPAVRWVLMQSAPLCALHQSDAFVSATVLS